MNEINLPKSENLTRSSEEKTIYVTTPTDNIVANYNQFPVQKVLDQTLIKNSMTYLNNTINTLNLGQLSELESLLHNRIKSLSKNTSSIDSTISVNSTASTEISEFVDDMGS